MSTCADSCLGYWYTYVTMDLYQAHSYVYTDMYELHAYGTPILVDYAMHTYTSVTNADTYP